MSGGNIQNCDCMDLLRSLPSNSIDLVITDPPYILSKCGGGEFGYKARKYHAEIEGMSEGVSEDVLTELFRVMKTPNMYIWGNWSQIVRIMLWLDTHATDIHTQLLSWHKSNPLPSCNNHYLVDTEYCLFVRGKGAYAHMTYENAHTYWVTPTNTKDKKQYGHPTIKPIQIIRQMIVNSSKEGDTVLDPFLGSGTTAKACKDTGRHCIGCEVNPDYYQIILKRLQE